MNINNTINEPMRGKMKVIAILRFSISVYKSTNTK